MARSKHEIVCWNCNGSGRKKIRRKRPKRYGPCPYCKGTGRREKQPPTILRMDSLPEFSDPEIVKLLFYGDKP